MHTDPVNILFYGGIKWWLAFKTLYLIAMLAMTKADQVVCSKDVQGSVLTTSKNQEC